MCQRIISKLFITENRIENSSTGLFLLSFLFWKAVTEICILFGPHCIISACAQDYELKGTSGRKKVKLK